MIEYLRVINRQQVDDGQNSKPEMSLDTLERADLYSWMENIDIRNEDPIKIKPLDMIINSDATLTFNLNSPFLS